MPDPSNPSPPSPPPQYTIRHLLALAVLTAFSLGLWRTVDFVYAKQVGYTILFLGPVCSYFIGVLFSAWAYPRTIRTVFLGVLFSVGLVLVFLHNGRDVMRTVEVMLVGLPMLWIGQFAFWGVMQNARVAVLREGRRASESTSERESS